MNNSVNVELFTWLHAGAGDQPALDFLSVIAAELTPYLIIICMALYWFTTKRQGKKVLLEGAAVVVFGLLLNQLITVFYFHPRPYMMGLCKPLISHGPETSFPSDHATLLFGAALALLFRSGWRLQGIFFLALAMAGAWGRIYTGLHFPLDIMGSFIVALLGTLVMAALRNYLTPVYDRIIQLVGVCTDFVTSKIFSFKENH